MSLFDQFSADAGLNSNTANNALPTYGTPSKLLDNLEMVESSGNPNAVNRQTGATGAYQFLPSTVAHLKKQGVSFDPTNRDQSRMAADYYIQKLVKNNGGDYQKAMAAYGGFVSKDPSGYVSKVLKGVGQDSPPSAPPAEEPALGGAAPPVTDINNSAPPENQPLTGLAAQFAQDAESAPSGSAGQPNAPENSNTHNFVAGVEHGLTSTAANVKQGLDMAATSLSNAASNSPIGKAINWVSDKLGLPSVSQASQATNKYIAANNAEAAPALNTTSGKIGNFVGQTAALAPTALIPGANTLAGASAIGAGAGLLGTEGDIQQRASGALGGALGGAGGVVAGKALSAAGTKLGDLAKNSSMLQDATNSGKNAMVSLAQKYGIKLNPQDMNPSAINSVLGGVSGKIQTNQAASTINQPVINNIIKKDLGLPDTAPLNIDSLNAIRQQAGNAYNTIRDAGTITPGDKYSNALNTIASNTNGQAKSFPGLKSDDISNVIGTLNQKSFDAGDAIDATRFLRNLSDKAYASGDKQVGSAYKQASSALEDAIGDHLAATGNTAALTNFQNARQTIAKTYSVQKAMNPATGDIDAAKLASQFNKGAPLSGGIKDVAQLGNAFPKATQLLKTPYQALSPLDYGIGAISAAAGAVGSGVPGLLNAATVFGRPLIRSALLSTPSQKANAFLGGSHYLKDLTSNYLAPTMGSQTLAELARMTGTNYGKEDLSDRDEKKK
jgi:hypothetical protein